MLHSKLFRVAFFAILVLVFASCESSDVVSPSNEESAKFLHKISTDSSNYKLFTYSNDLLTKYESVVNGNSSQTIALTYNDKNLLQKEEQIFSNYTLTINYSYNSAGRIDSAEIFIDSDLYGYLRFVYNNKNQVIKKEQYHKNEDKPWNHFEYTYDANDNVVEKKFYIAERLSEKDQIEYDDKINPYYNLRNSLRYDISYSKNNSNKITTYNYDTSNQTVSYYYITYNYDEKGYPTSSEIDFIVNGSKTTLKQKFEYQ